MPLLILVIAIVLLIAVLKIYNFNKTTYHKVQIILTLEQFTILAKMENIKYLNNFNFLKRKAASFYLMFIFRKTMVKQRK